MPEQERSRVEDQTLPFPMRQVDSSFGRKTQRLSDYGMSYREENRAPGTGGRNR